MTQLHEAPRRLIARELLLTAACAALSALGCAGDDAATDVTTSDRPLAQTSPPTALDAGADPPSLVEVTAIGTGCPQGSWHASISRDGTSFVITAGRYEAALNDGDRMVTKDCNARIRLRSAAPRSYAVARWGQYGYAYLDTGVRGFMASSLSFQEKPARQVGAEMRNTLTGPMDNDFRLVESPREQDLVWSRCARESVLNIITRIATVRGGSKGVGYINISTIPGDDTYGRLELDLKRRPCVEDVGDAGSTSPATSLDAAAP